MTENSKMNHYRVFFGAQPFVVKESMNPSETDGDFVRRAMKKGNPNKEFENALKSFIEQYNNTRSEIADQIADIERRLTELEDAVEEIKMFHESVIRPTHRREKVKESKKQSKQPITPEKIKDLPEEAKKQALRDLILKSGDHDE